MRTLYCEVCLLQTHILTNCILTLPTRTGVGQEPPQARGNRDACEAGAKHLKALASAPVYHVRVDVSHHVRSVSIP